MKELEQYLAENNFSTKQKNKYKFIRSLGHGGSKNIIHVLDNDTSRGVAMATLSDFKNRSEEEIIAFLEEAKISAILEHPNIVPVHDIGLDDNGVPYFTMKRLKGHNLTELLFEIKSYRNRRISSKYNTSYMLRIFTKICNAISFAHNKGIVHLDIKPQNIHLGEFGEVQIMDWGLARFIHDREEVIDKDDFSYAAKELERMREGYEKRRTRTLNDQGEDIDDFYNENNLAKGTPGFMAPEQLNHINPHFNERTDIYALGAMLYTILTSHHPVEGSIDEVITKTLTGDIINPRKKAPENFISPALDAIAMKALALNPKNRYDSVAELKEDIGAYLNDFATTAEQASRTRRLLLYLKRNLTLTIIFCSIFITGMSYLWIYLTDVQKTQYSWSQIARQDFSSGFYDNSIFKFRNKGNSIDVQTWNEDSLDGIKMIKNQWIWFKSFYLPINLKFDFSLFLKDDNLDLTVALNGFDKKTNNDDKPPGYVVKITPFNEQFRVLLQYNNNSESLNLTSAYVELNTDSVNQFSVIKQNTAIIIRVNGVDVITHNNVLPLSTRFLNSAGILANNSNISLTEFKLSRLEPPERSTALLNGDSLADYGFYRKAIAEYLNLAKYNASSEIAYKALKRAFIYNCINNDIIDQQNIYHTIKNIDEYRHLNFFEHAEINHIEAVQFWKNADYNKALNKMYQVLKKNPEFTDFNSILNQRRTNNLPRIIQKKLVEVISLSNNISSLNLSRLGISDLKIFEKLNHITNVDLSNNKISDISELNKIHFDYLDISNNYLADLTEGDFKKLNVTNLIYKPQKAINGKK